MGSMSRFYTRDGANEGTKIPLHHPDGSPSDDFLIIRSVDSDAFRDAESEAKRDILRSRGIDDIEERKTLASVAGMRMHVALIKDWSFDEECTEENIQIFLTGAPHIKDAIDQMASKRTLFVKKKSKPLKSSRSTKPSKRKPPKAQKQAPEPT